MSLNVSCLFQCSTLMLIESAKDSLSFSVTHYKHPKQPHTVQVTHQNHVSMYLRSNTPDLNNRHQWDETLDILFQAKSVEEKKLWAHHIKRIILENHHAIIPQKVRESNSDLTPVQYTSNTCINTSVKTQQSYHLL